MIGNIENFILIHIKIMYKEGNIDNKEPPHFQGFKPGCFECLVIRFLILLVRVPSG